MSKKAFTLIEMLVVIAIIWTMAMMMNEFDFNRQSDTEKRDRMVNMVSSIINAEKINAITWKSIKSWSSIINYDYSSLKMSSSWMTIRYLNSAKSLIVAWTSFTPPFFKDNGYKIDSIVYKRIDESTLTWWSVEIIFDRISNNISFSWVLSDNITQMPTNTISLDITAWYKDQLRHITFDYRTWKLEVK